MLDRARSVLAPLALLAGLLATGCLSTASTKGKVEKGNYHSPHGNYSLPIPLDTKFGRRIMDDARDLDGKEGYVSFSNDFGVLRSIEYAEIPAGAALHFQPPSLADSLQTFYREGLVATKAQNFPGLRSLHDEPLTDESGPSHFGVLFIPGGSTLVRGDATGLPTDERCNTVRAFLVFARDGFVYILGCATSKDASEPDLTLTPERLDDYKHTLSEMRASMRFAPG